MNVWMKRLSVLITLMPCLACAMEATPENLKNELNAYIQQAEGMSKAAIDKVKACNLSLDQLKQQAESAVGDAKKIFEDQLAKAKADATTAAEDAKNALTVAQKGFDEKINECQKGSGTLSTELLQIVQGAKQRLIAASNELTTLGVTAPVIEAAKSVVVPVTPAATPSKPAAAPEEVAPAPSAPAVAPVVPAAPKVTPIGTTSIKKAIESTRDDKKSDEATKQANLLQSRINKNEFVGAKLARANQTVKELRDFAAKKIAWSVLSANLMKPDKKS